MKEPIVSRIFRSALYAVFCAGILLTITLPFMLDTYFGIIYDAYSIRAGYRHFILAFLMVAGAAGTWVVLEMILMMRSIRSGPFVRRNEKALKRVGIIFALMAALFFGKCFVYVTILTMAGGIIFLLGALFAFTLAALFSHAVAFREENDLTI